MSETLGIRQEINRDHYWGHDKTLQYAIRRAREVAKEEVFRTLSEKCEAGESFHVFRYDIRQYRERLNEDLEVIEARLEVDKAVTRTLPAIVYPAQEIALYRAERPRPEPPKPKHDPLDAEEKEIILRRRKAKADAEKLKTKRQWLPWSRRSPIAKDANRPIGKLVRVPHTLAEFRSMLADYVVKSYLINGCRHLWAFRLAEAIGTQGDPEREAWFE